MRSIRFALGSLATMALVAGLSLATPSIALGSDGFNEQATTTYVVNPDEQRLDVTIDLTFKNTKKPTASTIYYYNNDYVWLEKEATNVRVTAPGVDVIRATKVKTSGQYTEYRIYFQPVLYYNKTRKIHITYQIPTGAPRSDSWFRISPAYLDFCVIGTGLDGGETRIEVPFSYTMSVDSEENGRLGSTIDGDTRIYTTGTHDDASRFWACLTGEQAGKFASTKVTAPSGREIDIQAWPDDPSWAADISTQIDEVLKQLEDVIGQALPGDGPIAVREVGAGTLGQYAGFFDPDTGVARIGEDLEATGLITHELSHAWFNGGLFQSHWLAEGHAEWARTAIDGDTCPDPGRFPGNGAPDLESWQFAGPRANETDLEIVDWQYAAACYVVRQVASRIGDAGMRTVLAALIAHDIAYRSGATVLKAPPAAASWQTWLDAVDELGLANENTGTAVATTADLMKPYGITTGSSTALAARAEARLAFHALKATFGDWIVPPVILQALAGWHFDKATTAMTVAAKVHEASADVADVLAGADGLTGKARTLLEAATAQADLDAALVAATDRLAAAREVAAAQSAFNAPRDLVAQAGLLGTDLEPTLGAAITAIQDEDLAAARSGAQAIQAALADAPKQGQARLLVGIGAPLLLLAALTFLLFRRRRRRRAVAGGAAMPELATLDAMLAPVPRSTSDALPPEADALPAPPSPPPLAPPSSEEPPAS